MFQMLLRVVGSIIFRYTLEEVNNVPKYEEIANILRERIRSKEYPPDSFLPNQVDLVKEFGASRMTIKKAINILAMEGLVYSQRGSGTKILNHPFMQKDTSPANEYEGLVSKSNADIVLLRVKSFILILNSLINISKND